METALHYRTRTQASRIAAVKLPRNDHFEPRMARYARHMLLRAYRVHGNKREAATGLGLSYRSFRYHWAKFVDMA